MRYALVLAALLGAFSLAACGHTDDRPCLKSHTQFIPMWTGHSMFVVPETVCDQYGTPAPPKRK